jgi:hypothetical protein
MVSPARTLPKRKKNISLYVEEEDEKSIKIDENPSEDDRFLARLSLDRLGLVNRILFFLGSLSTLYVSVATRNGVA